MSDYCNKVLTPQEQWLTQGYIPNEGRERTFKINQLIRSQPHKMDISRAKLFTESFKTTEGENLSLRWAKALMHIAQHIEVYVEPNYELIVGKVAGKMGQFSLLYPELDGPNLLQLRGCEKRSVSPFEIDAEDLKFVEEELYPYWKDRSYAQAYAQALPDETRKFIFGEDKNNFSNQKYIISQSTTARSSLNFNYDLETILKLGNKGFQTIAEERLAKTIDNPSDFVKEGLFWEAALLSAQACSVFIRRYAQEVRRVAEGVSDAARRAELMEIAENCAWIATEPARDFRSALQLQWFIMVLVRLEQNVGAALGSARMDQHLLPYYEQDIAAGKITPEAAKELFECYWLNLSQITQVVTSESSAKLFEGYAHWETVTIGGQTKEGKDATNALSYLILESKRGFPNPYPDLAARIHSRTPEKFLKACVEVIKEGQGFPKLFNDDEIVPLYIAKGATYAEALDYAVSGCVETRLVNRETYINGCAGINLGAVMELTMNNGRLKILGEKPVGLETGDPRTFQTFEDFFAAYKAQHEYILRHLFIQQMIADQVKPTKLAAPLTSLFVGACRDSGCDINGYVPNSIREPFAGSIGYATLIDSITAVKKLIYDEQKITMDELLAALEANFEGHEVLHQMLINAPKYGNNDAYADEVGKMVDQVITDYVAVHSGLHGEKFSSRIVPVTFHVPSGMVIGATPDGRKKGGYLSEGSSASHGAEHSGPTAILLSNKAVKHEGSTERAARLLNIKLSPAVVQGEDGTKKLTAFIRAWCDLRLWHIQFNVINKATLLAAQADPEKYKGLIVRVAGYSAYFTDLSPVLQDELIARTEHVL